MTDTPKPDLTRITPVRCIHADCPWAVHGIPDHFVGSRNGFLQRHLADDHRPVWADAPADGSPTETMSAEALVLRLLRSREYLADADASRLLAEFREQVRAEFAQGDAREILARHRDQVLTEAAGLVFAWSAARLDEIDEDDLDPSDMERHQERCEAANVLLAARTTQEN